MAINTTSDQTDGDSSAVIEQKTFDYSVLASEAERDRLRARGQRIREIKNNAANDLGRELAAAQEALANHADGTFQRWVDAETGMSTSTAYNLINVFKRLGSRPNFGQLKISLSAQYVLASPSTPDEALEEVVDRVEAGEKVTVAQVKGTVEEHKDAARLSDRDGIVRLLAENVGSMHVGILESRSKLHPKVFAKTIQALLDDGTLTRDGSFCRLADTPTASNDVVERSNEMIDPIVHLVAAQADGLTYADIRSGLDLKQTDHHGLLALRRALDTLLGSQRIQKVGALYRLAESPTAPDETPQEAHGEDEPVTGDLTSRILDALRHGQQWTVPQLQMVFGGSVRKITLIDTIEAMIDAGILVKLVSTGSVLPRIALVAVQTPAGDLTSPVERETAPESDQADVEPETDEAKITHDASSYAVGDYVSWRPKKGFDAWVGIVRQISEISSLLQVEAWTRPGDKHDVFMLEPEMVHPCTDGEYIRTWLLSTRQTEKELLCVEWKDHYIMFDGWGPRVLAEVYNYHPREKWDLGLAARLSRQSIDHLLAQGGEARMFTLDDLDDRMKDIVGRAGRARGGTILYPAAEDESVDAPLKAPDPSAESEPDHVVQPEPAHDELPVCDGDDEQPPSWLPEWDTTREMILARAVRFTAATLKAFWHGQEWQPTALHLEMEREGLIEFVYKWSSGSRWWIGYTLPTVAADQLETALINASSAIDLALKAPAPDWSQMDAARRDTLLNRLRQASDAAASFLEHIEVTWWPPEVEAESDAA